MRPTKLSVTIFLQYQDDYLFLHRSKQRKVDPDRLNGIGGKVEPGENYLAAAVRETKEETGYEILPEQMVFAGFAHLVEGYPDDWLCTFFVAKVNTQEIPIGNNISEGELIWIPKEQVLNSPYELVDDLNYIWPLINDDNFPFFLAAKLDKNEQITSYKLSY